ncbi:hypothetical protein FKM82_027104 [Ascaphus truei]
MCFGVLECQLLDPCIVHALLYHVIKYATIAMFHVVHFPGVLASGDDQAVSFREGLTEKLISHCVYLAGFQSY